MKKNTKIVFGIVFLCIVTIVFLCKYKYKIEAVFYCLDCDTHSLQVQGATSITPEYGGWVANAGLCSKDTETSDFRYNCLKTHLEEWNKGMTVNKKDMVEIYTKVPFFSIFKTVLLLKEVKLLTLPRDFYKTCMQEYAVDGDGRLYSQGGCRG